jgi:hypothetical protein
MSSLCSHISAEANWQFKRTANLFLIVHHAYSTVLNIVQLLLSGVARWWNAAMHAPWLWQHLEAVANCCWQILVLIPVVMIG